MRIVPLCFKDFFCCSVFVDQGVHGRVFVCLSRLIFFILFEEVLVHWLMFVLSAFLVTLPSSGFMYEAPPDAPMLRGPPGVTLRRVS